MWILILFVWLSLIYLCRFLPEVGSFSQIIKYSSVFFGKKENINSNAYHKKSAIFYKADGLIELKYMIDQPETSAESSVMIQAVANDAVEEAVKIYT